MTQKLFLAILLFTSLVATAQMTSATKDNAPVMAGPVNPPGALNAVAFDYDAAGNQIKRYFITLPNARHGNTGHEEALAENRKMVESPYEGISYYPNPVRSELYLEWKDKEGQDMKSIALYDFNGRHIQTFANQSNNDRLTINFEMYPVGIYELLLHYASGEQKSLKIIKN